MKMEPLLPQSDDETASLHAYHSEAPTVVPI
jgi:hypothetical protein